MKFKWYLFQILIPESHLDRLQKALQEVDAGHIGDYDSCTSYIETKGTWRPLAGSNPYDGTPGELSYGTELRVEVLVRAERAKETEIAIRKIHPYEEPVINVIPLMKDLEY